MKGEKEKKIKGKNKIKRRKEKKMKGKKKRS